MKWTSCKVSQTARRGCSFSILQNKLIQQTSKTAFIKCYTNSSMKFVFVQNRCYARKYEFFSCKYFETVNSLRSDNFMILDLKCFPWNWNLEPFSNSIQGWDKWTWSLIYNQFWPECPWLLKIHFIIIFFQYRISFWSHRAFPGVQIDWKYYEWKTVLDSILTNTIEGCDYIH